MNISGIAIGEWNNIMVKKNNRMKSIYKILRAYFLGAVSHKYTDGNYIVRYYNINLLVSKSGIIMTVWRDNSTPFYHITKARRIKFDNSNLSVNNLLKVCKNKHKNCTESKDIYKIVECVK